MAVIRVGPPKKRLRLKQGRFPDNGLNGIGFVEIDLMPNASHLTCPKCGSWKLGVSLSSFNSNLTRTGCSCGWESWIDAKLLPDDFTGSCPKCGCHEFVIIKLDKRLGCGCAKCSWEAIYKFDDSVIIRPR